MMVPSAVRSKAVAGVVLGGLAALAIFSAQHDLDDSSRRLTSYFRELAPVGPPLEFVHRFKDTWNFPPHSTDVPFLWYIPRNKADSLVMTLHNCYKLRSVFHLGYNASSLEGLQKMHEERALARFFNDDDDGGHEGFDYFYSPYVAEASTLFTENDNTGRLIVSFREPNRRLLSLFLKLKLIADPTVEGLTFLQWIDSPNVPDNWITRILIHKMSGNLNEQDHLKALQAVRKKAIIVLSDSKENKTQSMRNLERYFDWWNQGEEDCIQTFIRLDDEQDVDFPRGTEEWNTVSARNHYDNMLHFHVKEIFRDQTEELQKERPFALDW